jgi:hypothetical protein
LLNKFSTLANVIRLVRERLCWIDEDCEVRFEGRIDIWSINGSQMKTMSPVCNEKEWTTYVRVVMKSEVCEIELVARLFAQNNVDDESSLSLTLPEAVDEQHVKCGVVLTQPWQETHDNIDVGEPPFIASNKIVLNMKPVCRSLGVGDAVVDTGFISGVDHQPIFTGFTLEVEPPFIEPEFMPEYEAAFGDENAEDSAGDRLQSLNH